MAKIIATLSDDVNARLREYVKKRYGGKKGALSIVVEDAVKEYLDSVER